MNIEQIPLCAAIVTVDEQRNSKMQFTDQPIFLV